MQKECFMINVFNKVDGGSTTSPSIKGSKLLGGGMSLHAVIYTGKFW